ncbi:hypothetical protein Nepgr_024877 [Nepenthes gracilis]|uniref:BTB/POZ domain-containing protein n=1 Tax=Nepenthes gracilis TaxID=150966 RepID=A0AAD3T578_NEPGR|nr:hypothetical protein Nepgr_024877 [Nepenthes gracilis]
MECWDPNNVPETLPNGRIKLNVGGKLFETTASTVRSGGSESLLAALSNRSAGNSLSDSVFIDRDPEIFSVLLSLLRSNRLPTTARRFSKQELLDESLYYGIDSVFRTAISPPPLSGIDASLVSTIKPASDGVVSAFTAAADDGSILIAHAGQISNYDCSLVHSSSIRTHLDVISSIRRVWPDITAVGSEAAAGLHFYNSSSGRHLGSAHWTDPSDPRIYKSRAVAISDSPDSVFASFDCKHGENTILIIDKSTLKIVSELGRQSGNAAKSSVPGKLTWTPEMNILVGSAVTCGAFGYAGYIRLWDPRSGEVVWETSEPGSGRSSRFGDPFADVDVDSDESTLAKVCSKSGDLAVADMRKLGDDPWIYLEDPSTGMRRVGSSWEESVVHCYRKQLFVGRTKGLEVWSRTEEREFDGGEKECGFGEYRRNYVDKVEDAERGMIRRIEGGGNRLFVCRENVEGIEVWESSNFSGTVSVL